MNAQSTALDPTVSPQAPAGAFLGFGTVLGKEATEWLRGRRAIVVGAVSVLATAVSTVVPFIVRASGEAAAGPPLSMDPTDNVLLGWGGQLVQVVALLSTISLIAGERDRGTLAWNLANPVSRVSIVAAKFVAAFGALAAVSVLVPLLVSVAIATVAYGNVPDLGTVALFGSAYLTVPAFWVALTVALGTFIKSSAGIAGIAFAVLLIPQMIGGLLPILVEVSPTSIGIWAMAVATGSAAPVLPVAGWLVAMAALAVTAKLAFDRQEF